jgi:hypothetical protein
MNELVSKVADAVGLEPAVAEKAIGLMLSFLKKEGDDQAVSAMIAAIPGAEELAASQNGGGGFLGGLLGGGIMALGQQLMSAGLGMGEITSLAKETMSVARQYAGDQVVDDVIASVPGLGQFV